MKTHQVAMPSPIMLEDSFGELREPPTLIDSDDEECAHEKAHPLKPTKADLSGTSDDDDDGDQSLSQIMKECEANGWKIKTGRRQTKLQKRKKRRVHFAPSCEPDCRDCHSDGKGVEPSCACTEATPPKGKSTDIVGSLVEIITEGVKGFEEAPKWEELELLVDSGASATVIGEDMLKAI